MQVVLVMFRNDGERRSFSVVRNMTVIGRREDCDLRIPVGDVSRKHCRLVRTDDGIRIEDLGSSNGTYVNGERIQESELNAGDTVGVGPVQFIVQIDGVPDEEDMEPPIAAIPEPVAAAEPAEDLMAEEEPLEELPAEEEFQIEQEHEPVAETPLEEEPLEEEPLAEEPLAEDPLGELEELPLEEATIDEAPLEEAPAEVAAAPAMEDDLDFELEEEPLEETPAAVAPLAESLTEGEPAAESTDHAATAGEPLDELDDFELEESPATPATPAAIAAEPEGELDELELEEHPAAHAAAVPADSLDELEFEDSELELDETAPAAKSPKHAEEEPLELAPAAPAYAEVDIDSADEDPESALDELELEEEPHPANGQPAKTESDSAWDFMIEETDAARSHHDFKLDDSRHEQPHGQA
jgi:hypothetical protein